VPLAVDDPGHPRRIFEKDAKIAKREPAYGECIDRFVKQFQYRWRLRGVHIERLATAVCDIHKLAPTPEIIDLGASGEMGTIFSAHVVGHDGRIAASVSACALEKPVQHPALSCGIGELHDEARVGRSSVA
jgi:hypothetical protein